jgi:conjugative relaxase-like TrwC/TraI family protein
MMTIAPLPELPYYFKEINDCYYISHNNLDGEWFGYSALHIGLTGSVSKQDFSLLTQGYSPSGEALVKNSGSAHSAGLDFTFSAVKEISLLMVHDDSGEIIRAHIKAVKEALQFIERHAAYTRRGKNGVILEQLPGLLYALFTHFESRENDPMLHTHVPCLNASICNDLKWRTNVGQKFFQWRKAAGAIYSLSLANNMRKLGYNVIPEGESFTIKGVSKELCIQYSKRGQQITQAIEKFGLKNSANKLGDKLSITTRKSKKNKPLSENLTNWRKSLNSKGFTKEVAKNLKNTHEKSQNFEAICFDEILDELTTKQAYFKKQDLYSAATIAAISKNLSVNETLENIDELLSSEDLVQLQQDHKKNQLYTTKEVIESEQALISNAKKLTSNKFTSITQEQFSFSISTLEQEKGFKLSDEQITAIERACSDNQLAIVEGVAGGGKSIAMRGVNIAYQQNNKNVLGLCIAKKAANNLEKESGIVSKTIALFLIELKRNPHLLNSIDVLVIDEAGQVSSKILETLSELALKHNIKLVLVGESHQLESISRSGSLKYLSNITEVIPAHLSIIRRQRNDTDKEIVKHLRIGNAKEAIDLLNKQQQLHFANDTEATHDLLFSKWQKFVNKNPNKEALVLCHRWKDIEKVSEKLREHFKVQKTLADDVVTLMCTVSNKTMHLPFAVGEKIRFTKNDYKLGVSNGNQGQISKIFSKDGSVYFDIALTNEKSILINTETYVDDSQRLQIVHSYATTIYSSQGLTVDGSTFILFSPELDRANCYVAGSRQKDQCHWFINNHALCLSQGREINEDISTLTLLEVVLSKESISSLAIEKLIVNDKIQIDDHQKEIIGINQQCITLNL